MHPRRLPLPKPTDGPQPLQTVIAANPECNPQLMPITVHPKNPHITHRRPIKTGLTNPRIPIV